MYDTREIYEFVLNYYAADELRELMFRLGIDAESIPETTKSGLARQLVAYCARAGRLEQLLDLLALQRPESYGRALEKVAGHTSQDSTKTETLRDPKMVFISHAHQDSDFAQRLAADLRDAGLRVWVAPDSIRPGEKWVEAINRGLDESGVLLAIMSPSAVASRWVQAEIAAAIELESKGSLRFVPVEFAPASLPVLWQAYQAVSFRRDYNEGLSTLVSHLSGMEDLAPTEQSQNTTAKPQVAANRTVHDHTGMEMVYIPAGPFAYGASTEDSMAYSDERPMRNIELPEYWISRYPVTNRQYAQFVVATGHRAPIHWKNNKPSPQSLDHPVVNVVWESAEAFCRWAGLRLVTEHEWEKAARGLDGRVFPWGNQLPSLNMCNFDFNVGDTTPVGLYSPAGDSPFGCGDMAGNVWEWTDSWYDAEGVARVLRGGSWETSATSCRVTRREIGVPSQAVATVGFRCALPILES